MDYLRLTNIVRTCYTRALCCGALLSLFTYSSSLAFVQSAMRRLPQLLSE